MPRRGKIAKRDVLEDPIYNSKLVTRLINNVMVDGKKQMGVVEMGWGSGALLGGLVLACKAFHPLHL